MGREYQGGQQRRLVRKPCKDGGSSSSIILMEKRIETEIAGCSGSETKKGAAVEDHR
jgi:hypothetical protein